MNLQRIRASWDSYRKDVLPVDASLVQVTECKRAFYAGAQGLLGIIVQQLEPDREPTEADLKMMDEIERELLEFAGNVLAGRA